MRSGYKFCTLFADLANPTSNDIYQQIGYTQVADFHQYEFEQEGMHIVAHMQRRPHVFASRQRIVLALVALVGLVALGWFVARPASAYFANRAVPMRCFSHSSGIAAGSEAFLTCIASDGTAFGDSQRVPDGHYLLVTDIHLTPLGGTNAAAITEVRIFDSYGTTTRQSLIELRNTTTASYGIQMGAPYLVLVPTHRLEAENDSVSQARVAIRVSGFLVTNLNYLPFAAREQ